MGEFAGLREKANVTGWAKVRMLFDMVSFWSRWWAVRKGSCLAEH